MKTMKKCFIILLMVTVALPMFLFIGGTGAVADSNTNTIQSYAPIFPPTFGVVKNTSLSNLTTVNNTFAPLFYPTFGVKLFPCNISPGYYSVNVPHHDAGSVNGYIYDDYGCFTDLYLYLNNSKDHYTLSDDHGYYELAGVPFGRYDVYYAVSADEMNEGYGYYGGTINLTSSYPFAKLNIFATFS